MATIVSLRVSSITASLSVQVRGPRSGRRAVTSLMGTGRLGYGTGSAHSASKTEIHTSRNTPVAGRTIRDMYVRTISKLRLLLFSLPSPATPSFFSFSLSRVTVPTFTTPRSTMKGSGMQTNVVAGVGCTMSTALCTRGSGTRTRGAEKES